MKDAKRYLTPSLTPGDDISPDAVARGYVMVVRYADYAELKAERDAIKSSKLVYFIHGEGRWANVIEENKSLKAQLDRLTTWQPIETAPRDGTAILGCQGWCIEVTAYHKGTKPYHRKEAWVVANDDEGYAQDFKPTHWMPLPNPNPPVKKTKISKINAGFDAIDREHNMCCDADCERMQLREENEKLKSRLASIDAILKVCFSPIPKITQHTKNRNG